MGKSEVWAKVVAVVKREHNDQAPTVGLGASKVATVGAKWGRTSNGVRFGEVVFNPDGGTFSPDEAEEIGVALIQAAILARESE